MSSSLPCLSTQATTEAPGDHKTLPENAAVRIRDKSEAEAFPEGSLFVCRHTCKDGGCPVTQTRNSDPSLFIKRRYHWYKHAGRPHPTCKDPQCPAYAPGADELLKTDERALVGHWLLFFQDSQQLDDYLDRHEAVHSTARKYLREALTSAIYATSRYLPNYHSPILSAPSNDPKTFTIVVVPEPVVSRFSQSSQSAFTLSTAVVNVGPEDKAFLQGLMPTGICDNVPDTVLADSEKPEGTTTVAIWEWAYTLLLLRDNLRTSGVHFVPLPYYRFMEAMMDPLQHVPTFRALQQADMIFGGPSLNENWLDPTYAIGDVEHLRQYLAAAHLLLKTTTMFPNPHDSLIGGDKVILHATLDGLALAQNTPHFRPHTSLGKSFWLGGPGAVHKRGYSARSEGVILFDHEDAPTFGDGSGQAVRVQDGDKACIWSSLRACDLPPTDDEIVSSAWLTQVKIPTLLDYHFGELRVFVVGGKVTRVIQTAPWKDALYSELIRQGVPTRAAAFGHRGLFTTTNATWSKFIASDLAADDLRSGWVELRDFVLQVFQDLVSKERAMRGVPVVDIELFCRIDVGIAACSNSYQYFVLEVERGLSTCMWSWLDWLGSSTDMVRVAQLLPQFARRRP